MKKTILTVTAIASIALSGCVTQSINTMQPFQEKDLSSSVKSGALVQKTNTFFVIDDSSSSMSEVYEGTGFSGQTEPTKHVVGKELMTRMNKTIPDVTLSSGLRTFGFGPCTSWSFTKLNQPVQSYSSASFDSAINTLECSSGGTPIATAFDAAKTDLASAPGNIAVILFSDGHNYDISPASNVKALKEQYGDKLCVYTVWIGNEKEKGGRAVLQRLSDISGCGFSTTASAIASSDGMADFVSKAFFKPGVIAEKDSDGDGVVDSKDKCPNTPKGAIVDKVGCWAFHGVMFAHDSFKISKAKSDNSALFVNAVKVLKLNPSLTVEIQGHTDSQGTEEYNQGLSERRANAVKEKLVEKGINPARLTTKGFGELNPATSNATAAGRAHNRRVQYKRTDM